MAACATRLRSRSRPSDMAEGPRRRRLLGAAGRADGHGRQRGRFGKPDLTQLRRASATSRCRLSSLVSRCRPHPPRLRPAGVSPPPGRFSFCGGCGCQQTVAAWAAVPDTRHQAGVAKLADARDLKSRDPQGSCGFDPHPRHSRSTKLTAHQRAGLSSQHRAVIGTVLAAAPKSWRSGAVRWRPVSQLCRHVGCAAA